MPSAFVAAYVETGLPLDDPKAIRSFVRTLLPEQRDALAISAMRSQVSDYLRNLSLREERLSERTQPAHTSLILVERLEEQRRLAAERDERREHIRHTLSGGLKTRINAIITGMKEEWRVDWTAELLGQRIAMPDGTSTTWGEATVQQHRERLEMFVANATANVEGAARHQQAIEDLREARLTTLAELQAVAA